MIKHGGIFSLDRALVDLAVLGSRLDSMILTGFSNLTDSMTLVPIRFKITLRVWRCAGAAEVVGRQGSGARLPVTLTRSGDPRQGTIVRPGVGDPCNSYPG